MKPLHLRYSLRQLTHHPVVTGAVVANLALAIGAATAIFALADATLLAPLPYRAPDRLVTISAQLQALDIDRFPLSEPELLDIEHRSDTLAWVAGFAPVEWTFASTDQPRRVRGVQVTQQFFSGLGSTAALGRTLQPSDFEPGAPPVVVVSDRFWRSHLGADRAVVDREIRLDAIPVTVVGVMKPSFRMPSELSSPTPTEAWRPRRLDPDRLNPRAARYLHALGALKPDVSIEQADAEAQAITADFRRELPSVYPERLGWDLVFRPLKKEVFGGSGAFLALLSAAALLVLSIAGFNVVGLLLGRGQDRTAELATRSALGGTRADLVRLLAVESVLLFGTGAVLGLALAAPLLHLLATVAPAGLPRLDQIAFGPRALVFGVGLATLLLPPFGILPAWHLTRSRRAGPGRPRSAAPRSGRGGSPNHRRPLAAALVVGQVAMAFAVTTGAMLLTRSWDHLHAVSLGLSPNDVQTFAVAFPETRYDGPAAVAAFLGQLWERLDALPGVEAAGTIDRLPMTSEPDLLSFTPEGFTGPPGGPGPQAVISVMSGNLLGALGTPTVRGRSAAAERPPAGDLRPARAPHAVWVNTTLAQRYFPSGQAVGSRLQLGDDEQWLEIAGVVQDIRMRGPAFPAEPQIFVPAEWILATSGIDARVVRPFLVVRTDGSVGTQALRRTVWALDPAIPINESRSLAEIVAAATSRPRLGAFILSLLAGFAALLAATGVFALSHRSVLRQRREIGIRIALGATRRSVFARVFRSALVTGAAGLAVGGVLFILMRRSLTGFLYGVTTLDPAILLLASSLVMIVVAGAAAIPARRASAVAPDTAIRESA